MTTPLKVNVRCVTIDRCTSPSLTRNDDNVAGGTAIPSTVNDEAATLFAELVFGLVTALVGGEQEEIVPGAVELGRKTSIETM